MQKNYENEYANYEFKDSLLYVTYKEGLFINYDAACIIVDDRLSIQSYRPHVIVCNVSHLDNVDLDAREYLATYGSNLAKAVALYSTTSTMRNLAESFVTIYRPIVPTKIFNNLQESELYAKKYI